MATQTIFLLGATGFLGSQFLVLLTRDSDLPRFHVATLLRVPTEEKIAKLRAIYADLSVVEGTLDDDSVIQEQAAKAGYTINCASSDHVVSVVCESTHSRLPKSSGLNCYFPSEPSRPEEGFHK